MTTQFMKIENEAQWLAKRKGYVTSTQIPALFGLQMKSAPTAFELYHIRAGNIEDGVDENNFMLFGKLVEPVICQMILKEHPKWEISEFPYFAYDDEDLIGSSFDRKVLIDGNTYLLELKSTTYGEYKEKFIEHSEADIEAPECYEVQMQGQLEVMKDDIAIKGILMAVFIADTRQLRYIFRHHDAEMGKALRAAVREFVSLKEAPPPDFSLDKSVIARVSPSADPNVQLDATENPRITELTAQYRASKDLIKQEEAASDAAYAELLTLLGNAKRAWTNFHKITVSDIAPNDGTLITPEMVGTCIGGKKGYKRLNITEQKGK